MTPCQEPYVHKSVLGLPRSLLAAEDGSIAVIARMTRDAGLNRELRRELRHGHKSLRTLIHARCPDASPSDVGLLSLYFNPAERFRSFWFVVKHLREHQRGGGKKAYALAVDVQLLTAYAADWIELTLDEEALASACAEWRQIRDRVVANVDKRSGPPQLAVFMLWPRLLDDLATWESLDAERQSIIAQAIFSLASIGDTRWFIEEAIRICPALENDLGPLAGRSNEAALPDAIALEEMASAGSQHVLPVNEVRADSESEEWGSLLNRLDELSIELREHPSQEAVTDLASLVLEFENCRASLPRRAQPVAAVMEDRLRGLLDHLRALFQLSEFEWLDADLIAQIEARWELAVQNHVTLEDLSSLADDAAAAVDRTQAAADQVIEASQELENHRASVAEIEQQLTAAKGLAEQRAAKGRRAEAIRRELIAESSHEAKKQKLIDGASPYGEPFDDTCDYSALLITDRGTTRTQEQGAEEPSGKGSEVAVANVDPETAPSQEEGLPEVSPLPTSLAHHQAVDLIDDSGQEAESPDPLRSQKEATDSREDLTLAAVKDNQPASTSIATPLETAAASIPSVPAIDAEHGQGRLPDDALAPDAPYNDEAGRACRPIWQSLSRGQPALAMKAAEWTKAAYPGVRTPSLDLLSAVALESSLLLPDGSIQTAMAGCFERLSPTEFSDPNPENWHTAVNLLLASATMRAMIIAPGTGASSVAQYLHHDGNYPALYALVQTLRELSPRLMGFRIEPSVLRQARDEAAIRADLDSLRLEAEDWRFTQAPAYTIKFAAATNVWRQWLRDGDAIDALISPIIHNQIGNAERVREQLVRLSNKDWVTRHIQSTDRKTLGRRRGEDIHAGALDHLHRNVEEALRFPRQWLALVNLLGNQGDRLRELLKQVHSELRASKSEVVTELTRPPAHDPWGLVQAGQTQALRTMQSLLGLFDPAAELTNAELPVAEALGRDQLLVPGLRVKEDWTVTCPPANALTEINSWLDRADTAADAAHQRLERGDVLGAELLVQAGMVDSQSLRLKQERDNWRDALRREISDCRRATEIGSAYGYLVDADRGQIESRLAVWESQLDEVLRFDVAIDEIRDMHSKVDAAREARVQQVREALNEISVSEEHSRDVAAIEKALHEGDIATANELVHWLAQGRSAPTADSDDVVDGFHRFFPGAMLAVERWLEEPRQRRDVIEQAIRQGHAIPGLDGQRVAGAQREQASKMFAAWADMKAQARAEQSRLEKLFTGLGITVKSLSQVEKVPGREVWNLDAQTIEDRHICPVPVFGSAASGKYRVVCVWGRPTEDELLQWAGDTTVSRPTFLLYFGRMTDRKWRDLSRQSKAKRRAFTLLDETLLVYLCHATGSRLHAWFDVSLPFSFSSPYDATAGLVPPEMFYGRGAELDAVRGLNGRCFIYGGRQLGKTALLKRTEQSFHAPESRRIAKWIDLRAEGIGVSRAAAEIWVTLHEKLKELGVLDTRTASPVPGKKQGVEGVIRGIRDYLMADVDRRVLLLLDEADRFFEQDGRNDFEETRRLKQLMDETGRRFKVVFAGLHNVLRMTERPNHPLAHFGEPIEIGPLREGEEVREAADLIRRPMAAAGFAFESESLVIRILAQTNYYPSLIQLYCSHLLRHMLGQIASKQRLGPRYLVTDRDIEKVYSSDALRDEIRAKFRLTLQLDPRYEVVAYFMALDLLRGRYNQNQGLAWQTIRQSGAMHWWPEGFRDTSELDFRVLLDEMVGLGVLRRRPAGHYVLRNPNVLLLLGNQEEIETVLVKDREPAVEFESSAFHPVLRLAADTIPNRNAFTYQQLSRLLQRTNSITVVTGTPAAGIRDVASSLEDYLGREAAPVILDNFTDRNAFGNGLQRALAEREKDLVTTFVVPDSTPWTDLWLTEAQNRLDRLTSGSKFASLVFVAEPHTLWRLISSEGDRGGPRLPWMSLLHWRDEFLRHWLEDRQLQLEPEERRRLGQATGYWPKFVTQMAGDCTELRVLRERISTPEDEGLSIGKPVDYWRDQLGLDVAEPVEVIEVLAQYGEPIDANELAELADKPAKIVNASLRWAELLGLVRSQGAGFWIADLMVTKVIKAAPN